MGDFLQSKLATLFLTLSAADQKDLKKWFVSPWCNSNKRLPELHRYLCQYQDQFGQLSKEQIYRKVMQRDGYDARVFNNLMTDYLAAVKQWLVQRHLQTDSGLNDLLLSKALRERQLTALSNQLIQKSVVKAPVNSAWDHWILQQLHESCYYRNEANFNNPGHAAFLLKAQQHLHIQFALTQLRYACELVNRNKQLKEKAYEPSFKKWWPLFETVTHPAIPLYLQLLSGEAYRNIDSLQVFIQALRQNFVQFAPEDQHLLFRYAINHTVRLFNRGATELATTLFQLFQMGLRHHILLHENTLSNGLFLNIVVLAANLKEVSFIKQFVKTYLPALPPNAQKQAGIWAKSQIHYENKKLDTCFNLLQRNKFTIHPYPLYARVTLLKVSYDRLLADPQLEAPFLAYCKAFDKQLRRGELAASRAKGYLNLIRHTRKLAKLTRDDSANNPSAIERMKSKIKEDKVLIARMWLLRKLAELS